MDAIVKAALAKWPHVPHCYGWLALDARGNWYMRDERIQAAGPFPQVKGSRIEHDKLIAFIHRNYTHDEHGQWFFQNGPQRVYVELETTPWVWRIDEAGQVWAHVDWQRGDDAAQLGAVQSAQVNQVWLDEVGRLYLDTTRGFGIVHSQDMHAAVNAIETARWASSIDLADVAELAFAQMPQRFGYVRSPANQLLRG